VLKISGANNPLKANEALRDVGLDGSAFPSWL
jgi:hypothetical protein